METQLNQEVPQISLPANELLQALYFIWDAAERGQLQMFLIGDTAKQVIANEDLKGDKITVGVRRNEWNSGQGRIAQTFMEHELGTKAVELDSQVSYKFRGVPIIIKLYEENPCLTSFDVVYYGYETFNLPNPYKTFVEKYE
jgi:hypothetical protein